MHNRGADVPTGTKYYVKFTHGLKLLLENVKGKNAYLPGEDLNPQSKIQSLVCYQLHHRESERPRGNNHLRQGKNYHFFFSESRILRKLCGS